MLGNPQASGISCPNSEDTMSGRNAPTQAVPLEQAGMGKMKMALVGVGDGLPAAEVSTSALKAAARKSLPFNKVNEFGQSLESIPGGIHEEPEEIPGIRELVAGEDEPGLAPEAVIVEVEPQAPELPQVFVPHQAEEQAPRTPAAAARPKGPIIVGKISYRANYMEVKIPVIGVKFESPVLAIMTPINSDSTFEPPSKAEGVEVKFPKELRGRIPMGIPVDTWLDLYVTGIYFDVEEFGVRFSMFYINLNDDD